MSRSFTNFSRRNLAAVRLGTLSNLEYRINFFIDAVLQPSATAAIEVTLWSAIITGMGATSLGGFGREYYLSYALWAVFIGRTTANWMYEFIMLDEIDSGRVNAILVRPISFYEFFLSQFLGYKMTVFLISMFVPLTVCYFMGAPFKIERLPLVTLGVLYYLVFAHTLSFSVACLAFFLNRAQSFTGVKNIAIWVVAGELIPLDLYPEPFKSWLVHSPFAAGAFVPVGYLTGRLDHSAMLNSFVSVTLGLVVIGVIAMGLWRMGLRSYTGTGA